MLSVQLNGSTTAVAKLHDIAKLAYGSGDGEGVNGGKGAMGIINGKVAKFNTHWYNRLGGASDDMLKSSNDLRLMIDKLASEVMGGINEKTVSAIRDLLGVDDKGKVNDEASNKLLDRTVVAQVMAELESAGGVGNKLISNITEDEARGLSSRGIKSTFRAAFNEENVGHVDNQVNTSRVDSQENEPAMPMSKMLDEFIKSEDFKELKISGQKFKTAMENVFNNRDPNEGPFDEAFVEVVKEKANKMVDTLLAHSDMPNREEWLIRDIVIKVCGTIPMMPGVSVDELLKPQESKVDQPRQNNPEINVRKRDAAIKSNKVENESAKALFDPELDKMLNEKIINQEKFTGLKIDAGKFKAAMQKEFFKESIGYRVGLEIFQKAVEENVLRMSEARENNKFHNDLIAGGYIIDDIARWVASSLKRIND